MDSRIFLPKIHFEKEKESYLYLLVDLLGLRERVRFVDWANLGHWDDGFRAWEHLVCGLKHTPFLIAFLTPKNWKLKYWFRLHRQMPRVLNEDVPASSEGFLHLFLIRHCVFEQPEPQDEVDDTVEVLPMNWGVSMGLILQLRLHWYERRENESQVDDCMEEESREVESQMRKEHDLIGDLIQRLMIHSDSW